MNQSFVIVLRDIEDQVSENEINMAIADFFLMDTKDIDVRRIKDE